MCVSDRNLVNAEVLAHGDMLRKKKKNEEERRGRGEEEGGGGKEEEELFVVLTPCKCWLSSDTGVLCAGCWRLTWKWFMPMGFMCKVLTHLFVNPFSHNTNQCTCDTQKYDLVSFLHVLWSFTPSSGRAARRNFKSHRRKSCISKVIFL